MNPRIGVRSACKYAQEMLKQIEKELLNTTRENIEQVWALNGIYITLTANLLKISEDVLSTSVATGEANAKDDIREIQTKFNAFIDQMLEE